MNLKLILLITLIISPSIILSKSTTKKTTKKVKISKNTTLKKTTNKLIQTTTTKAKANETVSECYKSNESSSLHINENKIKCNSSCYIYKDYLGTDLVKVRACNPRICPGPYYATSADSLFKFDCCNTTNCNTVDKFDTLDYSCEFFKTVQPKQNLIYPSKILRESSVEKCYFCDDCKNPKKEAQAQACPVSDEKRYVCQYWFNEGLWNGYCETFSLATHVTFKKRKTKGAYCQTELCNSFENMKKIENMTLCKDGFYG